MKTSAVTFYWIYIASLADPKDFEKINKNKTEKLADQDTHKIKRTKKINRIFKLRRNHFEIKTVFPPPHPPTPPPPKKEQTYFG